MSASSLTPIAPDLISTGPPRTEERIVVIQSLRGLAALSVVWFHFTNGNVHFLPEGFLKDTGRFGWLGVEIFFVISGFILPYSLLRANYVANFKNYASFLWKRVSRLDPPYFASIALVIALGYVSTLVPGFRGIQPAYSAKQVLLHAGYMNAVFNTPWLNIVYWSLAIEFQYYLIIGLLFPLLRSKQRNIRLAFLGALGLSSVLIPSETFVFHYFFLFMLGFAAFLFRADTVPRWEIIGISLYAVAGTAFTLGTAIALTGLSTAMIILASNVTNRVLAFLGEVSYSLYLVHVPVGGRIINLGERLGGGMMSKLTWLMLALVLSVAAAFALFHFVERPCRRYASTFRFQ